MDGQKIAFSKAMSGGLVTLFHATQRRLAYSSFSREFIFDLVETSLEAIRFDYSHVPLEKAYKL